MRIAFFGGSFDPPHCGHLAIATAAADRLSLDRILFAPVGVQPLKRGTAQSSFEDRCAMVKLAIASHPRLAFSLLDAPQPGGTPNYTVDTLRQLKSTLSPDDQLFCLMGADSFRILRQWRRAEELLATCDFIVAARPALELPSLQLPDVELPGPGTPTLDLDELSRALPPAAAPLLPLAEGPGYKAFRTNPAWSHACTIYLLPDLDVDVSATAIRTGLGAQWAGDRVPAEVSAYIEHHGLYRPPHSL